VCRSAPDHLLRKAHEEEKGLLANTKRNHFFTRLKRRKGEGRSFS
jgi:hypothetical protein